MKKNVFFFIETCGMTLILDSRKVDAYSRTIISVDYTCCGMSTELIYMRIQVCSMCPLAKLYLKMLFFK